MVGSCTDNANIYPVSFIPTRKAVNNINSISGVEIVDSAFSVDQPDLSENRSALAREERTSSNRILPTITRDRETNIGIPEMRGSGKVVQPWCKGLAKPISNSHMRPQRQLNRSQTPQLFLEQ